ncbi:MAG: toprim domain-containing protein [Cyclobacteriaceae bacterium]|nr:toprim domain-containing protein [Cyclobacteriaceae bacterium]
MKAKILSYRDAKEISIVGYLSGLGYEPAKIKQDDCWYHSPFREERTPSFKVNAKSNVWFDHGSGEGGTILDLGAKLHQCTLFEFLEKLSNGNHGNISVQQHPPSIERPENKLVVVSAKEITNADLINYLDSRGIDQELANKFCKEIEFSIGPKSYKAIGFPNQSGAYELRNRWFKGSSSPKDISLIENGASRISVLEGFIDFLSVLKIDNSEIKQLTINSDFLILNSLRLFNRSLTLLQSYKEANLFLDNDTPAREAKVGLNGRGIVYKDASHLYKDKKDVNEFLIATQKAKQGQALPRKRSKGIRR